MLPVVTLGAACNAANFNTGITADYKSVLTCQAGIWTAPTSAGGAYCPVGSTNYLAVNLCVDNADTGLANLQVASVACGAKGLMVPDFGMMTAMYSIGASLGLAAGWYYTTLPHMLDPSNYMLIHGGNGSTAWAGPNNNYLTRCVRHN